METVQLKGKGITGIVPKEPAVKSLIAALPTSVKLGRIRPTQLPKVVKFDEYFSAKLMSTPPPQSINRRDKAAKSIARMYQNDRWGCCVVSGKGHAFGLWSAVDSDSGGEVAGTDQEILDQYHAWCGPGDNGCVITDVLDKIQRGGMKLGGKSYTIDGYVACDWTNKLAVQVVQYLFGATTIGIDLPAAWTESDIWDVTNTAIVGGHDVTPIDYDERGVYVASWGRVYLITWAAFTSTRWLAEFYVILSGSWYNVDKLAPCGVDANALKAALAAIAAGQVPDINPPGPTPPQPPPAGTAYRITVPEGLPPGDYTVGQVGPAVDPAALMNAINALLALFGYPPIPASQMTAKGQQLIPWGKVMAILTLLMSALSRPLSPEALAALIAQILAILSS